jgi:uncharacterized protein (TIGR00255 family)
MRSMTGYAKHAFENDLFKINIEIKSVNNKNLNIRMKTPYVLNFLENQMKTSISNEISRGSIDIRVDFEDKRECEDLFEYNTNGARSFMKVLDNLEGDFKLNFNDKLDTLLKYGNIVKKSDLKIDERLYSYFVIEKLNEALQKINKMKIEEGTRLKYFFLEKLEVLREYHRQVEELQDEVVADYRTRLLERVNKIKSDIDFKEEDILKEVLLFADRSDISEEVSRLASHLIALEELINSGRTDIGKKLDFILQEIFRELNTMGVKSNYYPISKIVVNAKAEVEKLREQGMNIE